MSEGQGFGNAAAGGIFDLYTKKFAYTAASLLEYEGRSIPGTATSQSGWQIRKFTYNASNLTTDIQWANGTTKMNQVWDDRASLTYS